MEPKYDRYDEAPLREPSNRLPSPYVNKLLRGWKDGANVPDKAVWCSPPNRPQVDMRDILDDIRARLEAKSDLKNYEADERRKDAEFWAVELKEQFDYLTSRGASYRVYGTRYGGGFDPVLFVFDDQEEAALFKLFHG